MAKHSQEFKLKVVQTYLSNGGGYKKQVNNLIFAIPQFRNG